LLTLYIKRAQFTNKNMSQALCHLRVPKKYILNAGEIETRGYAKEISKMLEK
jgi:hypothetical protein